MQVFHYLANQLKNTPNFENKKEYVNLDDGAGSIYNDFDFDASRLMREENNDTCFSQSSNLNVTYNEKDAEFLVPQEAIDHAVVEADKNEGIFYNALAFDHPLYDCTSSVPDDEYMRKVYLLATGEWKKLNLKQEAFEAYNMRERIDWKGPDTVYDALLVSVNKTRSWFPYQKFVKKFPDWEKRRDEIQKKIEIDFDKESDDEKVNKSTKKRKVIFSSDDSVSYSDNDSDIFKSCSDDDTELPCVAAIRKLSVEAEETEKSEKEEENDEKEKEESQIMEQDHKRKGKLFYPTVSISEII